MDRNLEGWQWAGTWGTQIVDEVAPEKGDVVLKKPTSNAFFGTPLNTYFTQLGIDTVIIAGGSTANCVRATVIDSSARGYKTIVIEDCVFDRIPIDHEIALFDFQRGSADVVSSKEVINYLKNVTY